MGYGLLLIGFLICAIASWNVNATFKRYQSVSNRRGMTAAEGARQILNENGLQFIQIERVSGSLTDHYDPRANVIRLSDSVYDSTSVVTLPVEFDASHRALKTLDAYHMLDDDEIGSARKVLTAAAMTYVASLVSSILQLVRLLGLVDRRKD